jgi:hypothetical protein
MSDERNGYGSRWNELMMHMRHELWRVEGDLLVLALDLSTYFELTADWTESLTQSDSRC